MLLGKNSSRSETKSDQVHLPEQRKGPVCMWASAERIHCEAHARSQEPGPDLPPVLPRPPCGEFSAQDPVQRLAFCCTGKWTPSRSVWGGFS